MSILKRIGAFATSWASNRGKWVLLPVVLGALAGVAAMVFQLLSQVGIHYYLGQLSGFYPSEPIGEFTVFSSADTQVKPWMLFLVATAGGLLSGLIVYTFAPEAEGAGTDAVIGAFHQQQGEVRARIPIVKTIASIVTIGSGGSAGREGPIAHIGGGIGAWLANLFKLSARDRRILLVAGMAAGVGAIFRAPLAGALFAAEILYSEAEFESDVIVPCAMTSIIAYTVYSLFLPATIRFSPLFGNDLSYGMNSLLELLPYAALSFALVLVAIIYCRCATLINRGFRSIPIPPHFKPAIGAALSVTLGIGLLAAFSGDQRVLATLSTGYGTLQQLLTSVAKFSVPLLLTIALAKVLTTTLTINSGGSGGMFGPSMVIGGCTGAAVGQIFHHWWPDVVVHPEAFALVGLAGFFAGAARAPISTIIMVSELTGKYSLLLPTMFCSTLCFLLCRRWSLYSNQVPTRLESPAHRGDFIVDILEGIKVREVFRPLDGRTMLVDESTSMNSIVHKLAETSQQYFPVINRQKRLVGIFSAQDVRQYLYNEEIWQLALANDIMVTDIIYVTPEDDLNTALSCFTAKNLDEIPVVAHDDPANLLGMLRRKETIAYYNRRLVEQKKEIRED